MERISEARCYGVLSCSASMRPQGLITWMKSDLQKGDWWSIAYPPAKANLITIRTKKKVYLNLLTNWAALRAVPMTKRKRKYPISDYIVNAPFVQKNYNKFKCSVDKWNKALLEYYRPGVFINADVMYTQFFIYAFTLQSGSSTRATLAPIAPSFSSARCCSSSLRIAAYEKSLSSCWPDRLCTGQSANRLRSENASFAPAAAAAHTNASPVVSGAAYHALRPHTSRIKRLSTLCERSQNGWVIYDP